MWIRHFFFKEIIIYFLDYLGNNLYWTDSKRCSIEMLSLDTMRRAYVHNYMGSQMPIALALMPEIG